MEGVKNRLESRSLSNLSFFSEPSKNMIFFKSAITDREEKNLLSNLIAI